MLQLQIQVVEVAVDLLDQLEIQEEQVVQVLYSYPCQLLTIQVLQQVVQQLQLMVLTQ